MHSFFFKRLHVENFIISKDAQPHFNVNSKSLSSG